VPARHAGRSKNTLKTNIEMDSVGSTTLLVIDGVVGQFANWPLTICD